MPIESIRPYTRHWLTQKKSANFYFFNNGITMICRKFRHNALQGESYQLKVEGIQIINGGQTCKTIQQTVNDSTQDFSGVYVFVASL